MQGEAHLDWAIYQTIRYFGLFKMPVTAVQIWRSLIVEQEGDGTRWNGQHLPGLLEIKNTLDNSPLLREKTGSFWGYYYLNKDLPQDKFAQNNSPKKIYVQRRLLRHAIAAEKWKTTRRTVRWLTWLPFVRMIAGSGSLAMFNTDTKSDLDLFVITRRNRIWTARLLLLITVQLTGRRRKYWNQTAPDKICLNHFITDDNLNMPPAVRNLVIAQLYLKTIPLSGIKIYRQWLQINSSWIKKYVMYPEVKINPSRLYLKQGKILPAISRHTESFLLELPGDWLEKIVAKIQIKAIEEHSFWQTKSKNISQNNHIVISSKELAFHPDTKVPDIIKQFTQEEGQRQLFTNN